MLSVAFIALAAPALALVAGIGLTKEKERHERERKTFAGSRGIALQTVIIMVVLLAIAGGIAAVLLSRGNQATNQLERQAVSANIGQLSETLCKSSGYHWDTDTSTNHCQLEATVPATMTEASEQECKANGYSWAADNNGDDCKDS